MRTRITASTGFGLVFIATLALPLGVALASAAADEVSAASDASEPFIVKIHADWCGACTALNGTFDELDVVLGSRARIVVLDVTDRESIARSQEEAERLGLRRFFDAYKSKTGTVGVLHGVTREPVKILKGETDPSAYLAAVALATAG
jgi:thiol-disulfide isomerase/thioredoxin